MDFFHDVRFALRLLRKQPVASLTIVLTLALGIGANTTMFMGFEAWVLRPLPFDQPEALVAVSASRPEIGQFQQAVAPADLRDWREQTRSFATLAAFSRDQFNLQTDDEPVRVRGARIDQALFPMLGIRPVLGRGFDAEEDQPAGPSAALLSDSIWRTRFGNDPGIVGRTLRIDGRLHEIVGVMEPGFAFPEWAEIWVPLALDPAEEQRDQRSLDVIGRLAPGVSISQAEAELQAVAARLATTYPTSNRGWSAQVKPLREAWAPPVIRQALSASLAAAALVLLIVCANVASLMLAQATGRQRETALRTALGASRRRLIRQTVTESMLFATAGGALGLLLGEWWLSWSISWIPVDPPYLFRFDGLSRGALGYTLGIALLAGLACGIAPLARSSGLDLAKALRRGDRSVAGTGGRLRGLLVVGQLAFAMLLVVGGLLMVLSFLNQQKVDPGYRTDGVMTARLSLTGSAFEHPADRVTTLDRILAGLESVTGVRSAGATSFLPASMNGYQDVRLEVEGRPNDEEPITATRFAITTGYRESLEIPLLAGRGITESESAGRGGDVALVSETLAARLWPGETALGRRLRVAREGAPWRQVVGVVGHIDPGSAMVSFGARPSAQIYVPYGDNPPSAVSLTIRSDAATESLAAAIRQTVRKVAPGAPIADLLTISQAIERVRWVTRYFSRLFTTYALLALAIAALGAYGIIADSEARRRRETGIRIALGAHPRALLFKVVSKGLGLGLAGVILGAALALPATRLMAGMLIGIDASDPSVVIGVAVLLLAISGMASYLPARQSARLDPTEVLRLE